MKIKFKNIKTHTIQLPGPGGAIVRFKANEEKILPEYYRKFVPRYLKIINIESKCGPTKQSPKTVLTERKTAKRQATTVPDIGIGILSCNRLHCIKRLLESIKENSPDNLKVIISDESTNIEVKEYLRSIKWIALLDHNKREGVVTNTNRLMLALMPYKFKLILNDDVEIKRKGWETFYFDAMDKTGYHHFCYRQHGVYGANKNQETARKVGDFMVKTINTKPHGAVLAFDDKAFQTVGYYDAKFPRYGMAHVDWSERVSKSGLQPRGFHDIENSNLFFEIHDEKTVEENKSNNLKKAREIYNKLGKQSGRIFVNNESPIPSKDLIVWINTYNRNEQLRNLLGQIVENKSDHNVKVLIFNDGSDKEYNIDDFKDKLNIRYEETRHHGKKEYWKLCTHAMSIIKHESADHYYWIPDDVDICDDFFNVSIRMWENILDRHKICLNLLTDVDRMNKPNWTRKMPEPAKFGTYSFWRTYWMDCCGIMDRKFFESINFSIPEIPKHRWRDAPIRSSGVGEYISKTLFKNYSFYQAADSLLTHGHNESVMNPEERKINTLKTNKVHGNDNKITFSMATMPSRTEALKTALDSIYNQADKINIYLNNFESIPEFLEDDKININMSQDHGDIGDAGKFFCCEEVKGYHFTVDDDIIYPQDYARVLIDGIEKYKRKYLIGIHASTFKKKFIGYRESRHQYHCKLALIKDTPVHMLGTGTLGYHTDTIKLTRSVFEYPNMADTWLCKFCQEKRIGMVALKRLKGWIKLIDIPPSDTIYGQGVTGNSKSWDIQNQVLSKIDFKIYGQTC